MKVVGKQIYDGVYEGRPYHGIRFYVTDVRKDVEGLYTETLKLPSTKPRYEEACTYPVGCEVVPVFNRYGQVEDIQLVKK